MRTALAVLFVLLAGVAHAGGPEAGVLTGVAHAGAPEANALVGVAHAGAYEATATSEQNPTLHDLEWLIGSWHGEGLGGEVDNPRWKSRWVGRKVFGDDGEPKIEVIKGFAPPPAEAPYKVDGLSGATLTSRGVTNLVHFWLGENGFGPFLERVRRNNEEAP